MSLRTEQVASVIQRAVQTVLSEGLSDPRIAPIITVTKVQVGRDLRDATVFVTMLPEDAKDLTMHGLRSAAGHVQHRISDQLTLKRTPKISFRHDKGVQNEASILRTLAELRHASATPDTNTLGESDEHTDAPEVDP